MASEKDKKISMADLRKGEVIQLSFIVEQAADPEGDMVLKARIGQKPEVKFGINAPLHQVRVISQMPLTKDIVGWDAHRKTSGGWGRVIHMFDDWLVVNLYDTTAEDLVLIDKQYVYRDPVLTAERDILHARAKDMS